MLSYDNGNLAIKGAPDDLLSEIGVIMHRMLETRQFTTDQLHMCVEMAAMSTEDLNKEVERIKAIKQKVHSAFGNVI